MYKRLIKMAPQQVDRLSALMLQVKMNDTTEHYGVNGFEKISVYTGSKWYDWNRLQKKEFKECFDSNYISKALIGWFLHFPANTGFLDLTRYWEDKSIANSVISYALTDSEIWLNNECVTVAKGEGIAFSLRVPHEVKTKSAEQNWACLMTSTVPA
jgi:hypothetical protein